MTEFNPTRAADDAVILNAKRRVSLMEKIDAEVADANRAAAEYAEHLADGGDPAEFPQATELPSDGGNSRLVSQRVGSRLVSYEAALAAVYDAWDEARGSRNPYNPLRHGLQRWSIAEYGEARIGQAVPLAEFQQNSLASLSYRTTSSEDVAVALANLQGDDLVLRRTKLDGKVAYLLRERVEGEEPVLPFRHHDSLDPLIRSLDIAKIPTEKAPVAS